MSDKLTTFQMAFEVTVAADEWAEEYGVAADDVAADAASRLHHWMNNAAQPGLGAVRRIERVPDETMLAIQLDTRGIREHFMHGGCTDCDDGAEHDCDFARVQRMSDEALNAAGAAVLGHTTDSLDYAIEDLFDTALAWAEAES